MQNLTSFNFTNSYYNSLDYKSKIIGSSDCNMFIPFYSLFAHTHIVFDNTINVMEYSLPSIPNNSRAIKQYSTMLDCLSRSSEPRKYSFKVSGVNQELFLHRGLIYKGEDIYVCLGIDSNYVIEQGLNNISSNIDYTKFTLFINNEFDNILEFKNIRKKVYAMYIQPLKDLGIDVVQTSRMNNWLFKNNFKKPEFKNVIQMMNHLKEVPQVLLTQ